MGNTFGDQLVRFVKAVDYLDDRAFERVRELVDDYTRQTLNIQVTRLMVASGTRDRPVLQAYGLAQKGLYNPVDLHLVVDGVEVYGGQTAYAFDREEPLWIVSSPEEENDRLSYCSSYSNLWRSESTLSDDFPKYKVATSEPVRTSIILPLRDDVGRVFGVFNFETTDRLQITQLAKRELENIALAMAISYQTQLSTRSNRARSSHALATLGKLLQGTLPKLTKPKIFFASSSRADDQVMSTVKEVLSRQELTDKYEVVHWEDMNRPGNISQQLVKELSSCRYGVCYLSERTNVDADFPFQDNPNVVFEAGMLHGRSEADSPRPAEWIPIREERSPTPPFDIAAERMIIVPRDSENSLKVEDFKSKLNNRLFALDSNG